MIDLLWLILAIVLIVVLIVKVKLHPAVSLIIGTLLLGIVAGLTLTDVATTTTTGFGDLMMGIGLSVGFGIILGQLMSDSGGAAIIARSLISLTSERFALYGLAFAAFVLSIPVFYDVTFVILIPLAVAIARQINKPLPFAVGVVALGAGTSHTLVPPTPNPLAAGEILGFDTGYMIAVGGTVGLLATFGAVFVYSRVLAKVWNPATDVEAEPVYDSTQGERKNPPPFFLAILPILVPVLLILMGTTFQAIKGSVPTVVAFFGDKTVAMLLGVLVAYLVAWRNMSRQEMETSSNEAVQSAGVVLLITGAGGSFGAMIQAVGIDQVIVELVSSLGGSHLVVLLACWLVGAAFRLAVGSGTVASITTMTIMASVAPTIGVHPVWVAIACLGGALSLGHINDSGFWVTAKIPGFTVSGGLKTYTLPQLTASVFILVLALIGSTLLPLS